MARRLIYQAEGLFKMLRRYIIRPSRYRETQRNRIERLMAWLDSRIPGFRELATDGSCPVCGKYLRTPRYVASHLAVTEACRQTVLNEIINYLYVEDRRRNGLPVPPLPQPRIPRLMGGGSDSGSDSG